MTHPTQIQVQPPGTHVQRNTTYPTPILPKWAEELAWQAVELRAKKKHAMLIVRFDGLAWQIFEAKPASRYVPE